MFDEKMIQARLPGKQILRERFGKSAADGCCLNRGSVSVCVLGSAAAAEACLWGQLPCPLPEP